VASLRGFSFLAGGIVSRAIRIDLAEAAMPLSTKRLREQFADAEQHLAETKAHVDRQRQIVKGLRIKKPLREEAVQILAILEERLRALEQYRQLIRSRVERGE
jgi:hypothetical protein